MTEVCRLTQQLSDADADALTGEYPDERDYDLLLRPADGDVDVYKPDGSLLFAYRPAAAPAAESALAWDAMVAAATVTYNRASVTGRRPRRVRPDGTPAKTVEANPGFSGYVGFADRTPRTDFCRPTAFTRERLTGYGEMIPLIRSLDGGFRRVCPDRHAAQMRAVGRTRPEWVIPGTAFTTVTANRNLVTRYHRDEGDLADGFGVIAAFRAGEYGGGFLVFSKYRVAVDLGTRDVLLCDVHEYHGNTPLVGEPGTFDRVTLVCYFRAGMTACGTPKEELARAVGR